MAGSSPAMTKKRKRERASAIFKPARDKNNPTGKSPKNLSIPSDKNIPLNPSGKSVI
jgi:hypothetical protein